MRTQVTLLLLALLAAATHASAQDHERRMAQIRQAYAARLEMMASNPYDDGKPFNEARADVAQNLPGSGMHERHDRYYFTQAEYGDEGFQQSRLYYVTSRSSYTAGIHVYCWEFLWDAERGDPMFALLVRQEGDQKKEYRFYFEHGKVIKAIPAFEQWPHDKDMMSLHPELVDSPDDVLGVMERYQDAFTGLMGY